MLPSLSPIVDASIPVLDGSNPSDATFVSRPGAVPGSPWQRMQSPWLLRPLLLAPPRLGHILKFQDLPSGYLTVCHGKSPFLIGKPSSSMGDFPWLC